ncbi:hypothetical protein TTHERM_00326730 (macronuclear) [Tetrahymena thermophila SB210]|uniref:Uncharacterized protein n=1 Tax=Tetrahymena thermophila (strain SB210) TaxID=312017 RepID=I7MAU9_TETTS|nr:hypothetical protein TTHERM_00326730 [Tetrahymena thermophila SB210]EAS06191.3 hypothetical protein TTHERM_00326730 [Tetrahymena thermophila SB210]|eukprot:XP_001026436.3 hypothetical protein TTHERM_00326730 [Tetrahymena thermophila SB210]
MNRLQDFDLRRFDPNQSKEQILQFYQEISQNCYKNLRVLRQKPNFDYKEDLVFLYYGNETQLDLQKIKKELLYDFSTMCQSSCQIRSLDDLRYVQCRQKQRNNLLARVVKNNYEKRFVIVHFYYEKKEKKQLNYLQNAQKEDKLVDNQVDFELLEKGQSKEEINLLYKTTFDNNQKTTIQLPDELPDDAQQQFKTILEYKTNAQRLYLQCENVKQNKNQDINQEEQIRRSERIKTQKTNSNSNYEFDEDNAYNKNKHLNLDQNTATFEQNFEYEMSSDILTSSFEENSYYDEDFNISNQRPKKCNEQKKQNNKSSSDEHQKNDKVQKTNQELNQFGNKQFIDQQQQLNNEVSFEKQNYPQPPLLTYQGQSGGVKQAKDNKKIIINQKRNMSVMNNSSSQSEPQLQKDMSNYKLLEENTAKKMKTEENFNYYIDRNKSLIEMNVNQFDQKLNLSILGQQNNQKAQETHPDSLHYDYIFNQFQKFYQEEIRLLNQKHQQADNQTIQYKQKILNLIKNKLNDIQHYFKQLNN